MNHEWENEPNYLRFVDEETGYECHINRNLDMGYLFGYIFISNTNRLYNKNLDELGFIKVHGGVTIIDFGKDKDGEDKQAIGFDCCNPYDLIPTYHKYYENNPKYTYKNIEYVKNECKKLAKQLKEYEENYG